MYTYRSEYNKEDDDLQLLRSLQRSQVSTGLSSHVSIPYIVQFDFKVILYSFLILKKMNESITDS